MQSPFIVRILSLGVVVLLSTIAHAADPFAENVRTTEPLSAGDQVKTFQVPPGFEVQLVAAEPWLRKPMNMQFDHTGRMWVSESREYPYPSKEAAPRDTIRIFSQFDANGRAGKMSVFATNLNIPIGLYPFLSPAGDGSGKLTWKCIAWSIPHIYLFEDVDGDEKADRKTPLYGPFDATRDTHGNQSSFRRGFDGWLYAHHGFNNDSRVTARDGSTVHMNSGNSYRIRLDGSRIEHHTHGQVNPFGMAFDEWGNIYSSDCHSAPTYQLLWGGYYPSFGKPHDGLGFAPVLMEHSHGSTAIDGMLYYADDLWPEEFKDNIFIGNVMTSRVNRDRLRFNGASPRAIELDDFVKTSDPWFRPVDNLLGPDGAFYIADFYNRIIGHYEVPLAHPGRDRERGRIFRVIYKGQDGKPKLRPLALESGLPGLINELRSPSLARRLLAMNAITDQFGNSARDSVRTAVSAALNAKTAEPANDRLATHGMWLLWRLGVLEDKVLTQATEVGPLTRVHALRLITERGHQEAVRIDGTPGVPAPFRQFVSSSLSHSNALVQRCAVEALGKWTSPANIRPLVELRLRTPANDTHLIYVTRKSLRDQLANPDLFQQVLAQQWSEAEARVLADVCPAITNSIAASFLLGHLQTANEPRDTTAAYLRHAARYLPQDRTDDLATFVREKFADDVDFQWALFKPIIEGLAQRGVAPGFRMKVWGDMLADGLLSSVRRNETDWISLPIENRPPSANPWVVQRRQCSDGKSADLLCSLPHGESLTGVLRSKEFTAPATMTFWMAGHDGFPESPLQGKNFVRLRDGESHDVLFTAPAPRQDIARKITWDLAKIAGQQVYVELVDGDTAGAYAWLAAGRFEPAVVTLPRVTPNVIDERLQAIAQIAVALNDSALEPQLLESLKIPSGPDTRASLATGLLKLNANKHLSLCSKLLKDESVPLPARQKLALAMNDANLEEARTALAEAVRFAPERNQPKLAVVLAGNRPGAEMLLREAEAGRLPARLLQERTVKEKITASKAADAESRIKKLTENLSPLNAELQKTIEQRRSAFNPGTASASRGSAIFERTCGVCHQIDGKGAVVGPQLDGIGARGVERILEDTIDPNRNVDTAFRTTIFVLEDDDVVSGLFRREEGAQIVYADSTGKEITVPKKSVKERRQSELSLMPEGLAEGLTQNEFNDLVAFLLTKSGANK